MKLGPAQSISFFAALLAVVGIWRWWSLPDHGVVHAQELSTARFEGPEIPRANELSAAWLEPEAQSAGREWIFEVFTPPIVYFDETTQRFTVIPPLAPMELPTFGVDLLAITQLPYRLQYAGHHGVDDAFVVEIKDVESGRFYRGRPGATFPKGEFALREFKAERLFIQPKKANQTPYIERSVSLLIEDFKIGETLTLGRDALILPDPVVILEDEGGQRSGELRVGEEWNTGGSLFQVASIDVEANAARIARLKFDGSIESEEVLTLVGPATESEM